MGQLKQPEVKYYISWRRQAIDAYAFIGGGLAELLLWHRTSHNVGPGPYSHFTFFRYRYSAKQNTETPPIRIQ